MNEKKYPVGIQNFEKLRTGGYVYVDKTALVYKLVNRQLLFSEPSAPLFAGQGGTVREVGVGEVGDSMDETSHIALGFEYRKICDTGGIGKYT